MFVGSIYHRHEKETTELGFVEKLSKPTLTEQRIARCEHARNMAHDPDIKIIWEGKARQLRDKRIKKAH